MIELNKIPEVTKNLLIINALFYFANVVGQRYGIDLNHLLGLHYVQSADFGVYQLVTYMFMHSGLSHVFFNMFALWMFGRILEQVWGPKRFLLYYLACGIGAGLVQELVYWARIYPLLQQAPADMVSVVIAEGADVLARGMNYSDPLMGNINVMMNSLTVGASGSVYGILLAFGMLFPEERLFIMPIPVPIKAKYFVIGYAVLELYLGFANNAGDNVAHFAHLGGMIFGFILIMYWKKKRNYHGGFYQ